MGFKLIDPPTNMFESDVDVWELFKVTPDPNQPADFFHHIPSFYEQGAKDKLNPLFCFGMDVPTPKGVSLPCDLNFEIENTSTNPPGNYTQTVPMTASSTRVYFSGPSLNSLGRGIWQFSAYAVKGQTTWVMSTMTFHAL
ncbi:hypothetical protein [Pseudomonas fluorescens]|uniref:hypothetical protein n=1 Tax=Pseudomonas fluorescens TaxID=294 RepID=UPI0011CEB912|nr:hypothetical protein [Pseudomonas fluorescens]